MSRRADNQERTKGNVPAPKVSKIKKRKATSNVDAEVDPSGANSRRNTNKESSLKNHVGRSVGRETKGKLLHGVVRNIRYGVCMFVVAFVDSLGGVARPYNVNLDQDDLLPSTLGDNTLEKLSCIRALNVGATLVHKIGDHEVEGTVLSRQDKDLFLVKWGNKTEENIDIDGLNTILRPRGHVERIIEEVEDGYFKVKWWASEIEEIVSVENLPEVVLFEFRLQKLPRALKHPYPPDPIKGYKKQRESILIEQALPKHTARIVRDTQEKERTRNGKIFADPDLEHRCGWKAGGTYSLTHSLV
jgi:hypothetical protein